MSADSRHNTTDVWEEIRQWPSQERLALATRILEWLAHDPGSDSVLPERSEALRNLMGIWRMDAN